MTGRIHIVPRHLDFGDICTSGSSKDLEIAIGNSGETNLIIQNISIYPSNSSFAILNPPQYPIQVASNTALTPPVVLAVRYTPKIPGEHIAHLIVTTNSTISTQPVDGSNIPHPSHRPLLTGVGLEPRLDLPANIIIHKTIGCSTGVSRNILISNSHSNCGIKIQGISVTPADFTISTQNTTFPHQLYPNENLQLTVTFNPRVIGKVNGSIHIFTNTSSTPYKVDLIGYGLPLCQEMHPQDMLGRFLFSCETNGYDTKWFELSTNHCRVSFKISSDFFIIDPKSIQNSSVEPDVNSFLNHLTNQITYPIPKKNKKKFWLVFKGSKPGIHLGWLNINSTNPIQSSLRVPLVGIVEPVHVVLRTRWRQNSIQPEIKLKSGFMDTKIINILGDVIKELTLKTEKTKFTEISIQILDNNIMLSTNKKKRDIPLENILSRLPNWKSIDPD